MQQALNREGYSLDVDGGFGKKTLAALMDYQRRVWFHSEDLHSL